MSEHKNANIVILFRNTATPIPKVYEEYNSKLDQYTYSFNLMLDERENEINKLIGNNEDDKVDTDASKSYYSCYEQNEIYDCEGVFVFLIDQSGSMSGSKMEVAKESLTLFLKSLPAGSYFDIIGFGSTHKSYFQSPMEYIEKNLPKAQKIIQDMTANLGGTEIYTPLDFIFKRKYDNSMIKNVFLITDGKVKNSAQICSLIESKSTKDIRVHSIGIGNDVDKNFIRKTGEFGKGSFHFATQVDELKKMVILALRQSIKPYINNIKLNFSNQDVKIELDYPSKRNLPAIYQDEIFNYSFITKTKLNPDTLIDLECYNASLASTMKKSFTVKEILCEIDGTELIAEKLLVGLLLKYKNDLSTDETIKLSKTYQVLSKETALFAEIEQTSSNNISIEPLKFVDVILNVPVLEQSYRPSKPGRGTGGMPHHYGRGGTTKMLLTFGNNNNCVKTSTSSMLNKNSVKSIPMPTSQNFEIRPKAKAKLKSCKMASSHQFKGIHSDQLSNDELDYNNENFESDTKYFEKLDKPQFEMENVKLSEEKKEKDVYKKVENLRRSEVTTLKPSMSNLVKNDFSEASPVIFNKLIDLQKIEGNWNYYDYTSLNKNSELTQFLENSKYKIIFESLVQSFTNLQNLKTDDINTFSFTILVLIILNQEFTSKKDEFILIENKGKKFLSKKNVQYKKYLEDLKLENLF